MFESLTTKFWLTLTLAISMVVGGAVAAYALEDWQKNAPDLRNSNTGKHIEFDWSKAKDPIRIPQEGLAVIIDHDRLVQFPDAQPYINSENNRTMIPIRFVAQELGVKVDWDGEKQIAIMITPNTRISLPVGSNKALVNGQEKTFDAPAEIRDDRTYVPLRFVSEAMGAQVKWIPPRQIYVDRPKGGMER